MNRYWLVLIAAFVAVACSSQTASSPAATDPVTTTPTSANPIPLTTTSTSPTTSPPSTSPPTNTAPLVPVYVFPFEGRKVSYGTTHHDYPAIDVFGCGAKVVAPTSGTVTEARSIDLWDSKVNDPATRGGLYVTLFGDDGVRYYFAHLASLDATVGARVAPGDALGIMGQTGNARLSACHTHVGISWPCPTTEWQVRRGEIWPSKYLDAWRGGEQLSPIAEVVAEQAANPQACDDAARAKSAAAA